MQETKKRILIEILGMFGSLLFGAVKHLKKRLTNLTKVEDHLEDNNQLAVLIG